MTAGVIIRPATADDAEPVRVLLADAFVSTYAPLVGAAATAALHERWHSAAALGDQLERPGGTFLVAEEAEGVVGHAYAAELRPGLLVVFRLYVASRHQGRGLGSALLRTLVSGAPDSAVIRLDVAAGNARALAFYAARGFRRVSESESEGIVSIRLERIGGT